MRFRALTGCLLAALLCLGLVSAPASAKPRAKTEVNVRIDELGTVVGKVKSVKACEPGRRLSLIQDSDVTGREVIATTRSKRAGRYEFPQTLFQLGARYTVEAAKRDRSRVTCKAGKGRVPLDSLDR